MNTNINIYIYICTIHASRTPLRPKPLPTHLDEHTLTNIRNTLRAAQKARRATRVFAEAVFVKAFVTGVRNGIREDVRIFKSYIDR